MSPVLRGHRSVKGDETCRIGEVHQQSCDVAVANEYLGMSLDLLQVQPIEQVVRSVASAGAEDGTHVIAFEHVLHFADTALDGTGVIEIAIEDRVEVERAIPSAAQRVAPCVQIGLPDITGGRDDADRVSETKSGRFNGWSTGASHGLRARRQEYRHAQVQLRKNRPRHNKRAGPRKKILSPWRRTVCVPPGACTLTAESVRPGLIAATADAHEPVPEDRVSPAPRSKNRARRSNLLSTATNSMF